MNSQRNHQVEEFAAKTLTDALTLAARRGYGQTAPSSPRCAAPSRWCASLERVRR